MEAGRDGPAGAGPGPERIVELEGVLGRLAHVRAVRVVGDGDGRPVEVHVLAGPGKRAKQLVRDVQSVAMASLGVRIDRRIVSVVQLDGEEGEIPAASVAPERSIVSIRVSEDGLRALVEVTLATPAESVTGYAEGSIAQLARPRLVALATLDALHQSDESTLGLDVEGVRIVSIGSHDVAVVMCSLVEAVGERLVAATAVVESHGTADAVARAVVELMAARR